MILSERFKKTVLKELKLDNFEFDEKLKANQVPGWDSLSHAIVIAALEREYKIRLKNIEIINCANLGDLMELINSKIEQSKEK